MVTRVHYRRKHVYRTPSNKWKFVRTPGGKLSVHYLQKRVKGVRTPKYLGGRELRGIAHVKDMRKLNRRDRTVSRAYGGSLNHNQVRDRVIRSFLINEQNIVKMVLRKRR
eukprot:NODE_2874_length_488_cov_51.476454_g2824_i0.p2 GENE.NODE_2874_length_488_cov_51.476454_g2824_i0~~NODE_2874_length_488_cov_51.476454_g2824_i0.p2  ORF type:complete len:110 (+),score=15.78 NODE_2874_length_488_cov_51.476454_g2824_i0:65-394(+)